MSTFYLFNVLDHPAVGKKWVKMHMGGVFFRNAFPAKPVPPLTIDCSVE
jgi:hypothetical protein